MVGRKRLEAAWLTYERVFLPSKAARTHRGYRAAARRFLSDLPDPFTLADLVLWRGRMLEERHLAVSYVNQAIKVLRGITRHAGHVTGDIALASIFAQLETLKEPIRAPRCPPADYVDRILGATRNPAERAFVLLTSLAGLRRDEVLGLMPEDWDAENGILAVTRQRQRGIRKNGRPHSVRVNARQLRWYLNWTVANHAILVPHQGPPIAKRRSAPYLFPWTHTYVEGLVDRIRRHLGTEAARYMPRGTAFHAGRHWGTTELARRGVPLFEIQAWRGDADSAMTATYVSMVRGMTSGSVALLANRWRAHARRPACRVEKVGQRFAARRSAGPRRHGDDGTNPLSGAETPRSITRRKTTHGKPQSKPSRGRTG